MDKKILQNYFYNILYQLLVVLAPMITVPYVTRTLGATMLGISDWTGSNVQWFVLFGIMGVSIYGNREIARVRDDQTKMSKTFFEIFTMQFLSMCACMRRSRRFRCCQSPWISPGFSMASRISKQLRSAT